MTTQPPPSPVPLFRPEVARARANSYVGAVRLAQPVSGWLIALVASAIIVAFVAFVCLGTITGKARVTGITVPVSGSVSVTAAQVGVLLRNRVKEGDHVTANQVLFELSTERQGERGEISALVEQQLGARIQSLQSEQRIRVTQAQEKLQALSQRLSNLDSETAQLKQELILARRRSELAHDSVGKYQALLDSGYVSPSQLQQKQEDAIDADTRVSSCQRNLLQLQANKVDLESEQAATRTGFATDQAQIERSMSSLQQDMEENRARKSFVVLAPQAGVVGAITAVPGQSIGAGAVLATLLPDAAHGSLAGLEVHLYVPSRTSGFVAEGQRVQIRYQSFPYQKFGLQRGTIVDVSRTPFAPNELPTNLATTILSNAQQHVGGFNTNEALYRIRVALDKQTIHAYGREQALKPGMTLDADIVQDRRRIWEWILEPLLAVKESTGANP